MPRARVKHFTNYNGKLLERNINDFMDTVNGNLMSTQFLKRDDKLVCFITYTERDGNDI